MISGSSWGEGRRRHDAATLIALAAVGDRRGTTGDKSPSVMYHPSLGIMIKAPAAVTPTVPTTGLPPIRMLTDGCRMRTAGRCTGQRWARHEQVQQLPSLRGGVRWRGTRQAGDATIVVTAIAHRCWMVHGDAGGAIHGKYGRAMGGLDGLRSDRMSNCRTTGGCRRCATPAAAEVVLEKVPCHAPVALHSTARARAGGNTLRSTIGPCPRRPRCSYHGVERQTQPSERRSLHCKDVSNGDLHRWGSTGLGMSRRSASHPAMHPTVCVGVTEIGGGWDLALARAWGGKVWSDGVSGGGVRITARGRYARRRIGCRDTNLGDCRRRGGCPRWAIGVGMPAG